MRPWSEGLKVMDAHKVRPSKVVCVCVRMAAREVGPMMLMR